MARDTYETKDELDVPQRRDGLGSALIILTPICRLVGVILTQKGRANRYEAGILADKGATPAPAPAK